MLIKQFDWKPQRSVAAQLSSPRDCETMYFISQTARRPWLELDRVVKEHQVKQGELGFRGMFSGGQVAVANCRDTRYRPVVLAEGHIPNIHPRRFSLDAHSHTASCDDAGASLEAEDPNSPKLKLHKAGVVWTSTTLWLTSTVLPLLGLDVRVSLACTWHSHSRSRV